MSMNIIFNGTGQDPKAYLNKDRETTGYQKADSTREVCSAGFALDISGTVTDNSAYAGHGRTAEEVMQKAGMEDITARRNYMAVMSNSVSDEDFAKILRSFRKKAFIRAVQRSIRLSPLLTR